jgi:hypothetical protein
VTAELKDEGDATSVVITTDLTISGKAAQFGRGVLADVATNLIGQFARRLEADLLNSAPSGQASAAETRSAAALSASAAEADARDSVDLLKVAVLPLAKRTAPVAAGIAVGMAIGYLLAAGIGEYARIPAR